MTRTVLALALLSVVCLLALPAAPPTEATTELSGPILANTLLSRAASPYHVTGPVAVAPGVTLTIEPGVRLNFAVTGGLLVSGRLVAEGASTDRITFAPDDPSLLAVWSGLTVDASKGGTASLTFVDISGATTGVGVVCCATAPDAVHIADATISRSLTGLSGSTGTAFSVERTTFGGNNSAISQAHALTIVGSTFQSNAVAINLSDTLGISSSTFDSNQIGVSLCACTINGNTFTNNDLALKAKPSAASITYNAITNNRAGLELLASPLILPLSDDRSIDHNNIFGNALYNLSLDDAPDQSVPNNWWGTTDTGVIDAGISDAHDRLGLGVVSYQPILTGPVDLSSQLPPAFTPTATATRTATLTATPTQPSATATPTPTLAPPGSIACVPRPRVDVTTVSDGPGRLRVTITAQSAAGAPGASPNRLARLTIASANNAVVESGQPLVQVASPMLLASRPVSTTLWVRRLDPALATTVHLLIDDDCGQWPTFVGGGPGSF
jgi:hypothetical protein